jgi:hypothetical protein
VRSVLHICLYEGACTFKSEDRKTKLPICRNYDRSRRCCNPCSQLFYITPNQVRLFKDVEELRKMKLGIISALRG